ncbi:MAG: RluA family pseudouridine synthase [Blautia sp.]|nr:RluA family pseudouridine synthase [Blautia sp.]MDD7728735.1 RluA family pseudouridine synthase [Clostridia bacterium]MDY5664259.1 RluA family pseudouridine synthase [Blautia sp.]
MQRTLTYEVTEEYDGMEILAFLRQKGFSRNILSSMKKSGQTISHNNEQNHDHSILQNGERGYGHSILKKGDTLTVHIPETESDEKIIPVKMELDILYEDEDILVINKEANVPVHPSIGNYENTLANGVAYYFAQKGQDFVYRCINRLDRDTTGALILAKNPYSAAVLSTQMKRREIRRTYLAIVEGIPPKSGTIDAPVGRVDGSAITRQVDYEHGERAVTHFTRLAVVEKELSQSYSLIELHLETGRTHQIRVHMKHLGYPLPGDYLYHPDYRIIGRQPLHSYQLEFVHPVTEKPMLFTAPVPLDFVQAFRR